MSDRDRKDRDERTPEGQAAREPEATLDRTDATERPVEPGPPSPEPMPDGPNEDYGFQAAPPRDVTMNRTSDDNDLNPAGSGVHETPFRHEYESIARRDDLSRRLEDLIAEAREWAQDMGTDDAREVVDSLTLAYDRLGVPTEDTDAEPDVAQAETGNMEAPGRD